MAPGALARGQGGQGSQLRESRLAAPKAVLAARAVGLAALKAVAHG